MELKKTPKANLQNKKFLFFEIGLSISLLAVFVAFNWTTREKPQSVLTAQVEEIIEEEEQVPIAQVEPPPPQEIPQIPQIPEEIEIVDNTVEIKSNFDFSESETNKDLFTDLKYVEKQVKETVEEVDVEETIPFAIVEKKPMFQGKDAESFRDWIYKQIEKKHGGYPAEALENNIQGTVRVSFTVNTDGTLSDIKSTRKVDPILENAVLEIVKQSPKWTPGSQQNKPVKVPYQVPIVFKIQS
ncbi:MAG: energy transducer TonB [Prevotellaceae bacterium]|jgi:protein TonB|nr:energy transducer TonB [Prevotellaceae bacterium]